MCDLNGSNLIDLSLVNDMADSNEEIKGELCEQQTEPNTVCTCNKKENESTDGVQKLTNSIDDPFDIEEGKTSLQALNVSEKPTEVRLGNLLSLSNDHVLDKEKIPETPSVADTVEIKELYLESPPVTLHNMKPTDSISESDSDNHPISSGEMTASAKLKKNTENRKKLLKLSISNSAYNSPTARTHSLDYEDQLDTPVSSMLAKAAEFGEHSLASESPLKLVEDEDVLSERSRNILDSQKNFEADLEMLKIPILNELPASPVVEVMPMKPIDNNVLLSENASNLEHALPNLEAIKSKLNAKKIEMHGNQQQQQITSLIHNLKTLISCGDMVDTIKKKQACDLLESLSLALNPIDEEETPQSLELLTKTPQLVKRQSTFDMDMQEKEINIDNQLLVEDMPNCMISSSATYDGEPYVDHGLNLPEIEPLYTKTFDTPSSYQHDYQNYKKDHLNDEVNDIVEQLSNILINNNSENPSNRNHPTVIVVMNANQFNHSSLNSSNNNDVECAENDPTDGSPDLSKINSMYRRRSQSLSIHDKVKIVQLPMKKPETCSILENNSIKFDESSPPSCAEQLLEYKTPARMERRYSYSSGTPYTAQTGAVRKGYGSDIRNYSQLRKMPTLDTHHEGQKQSNTKPLSIPYNNLYTYKPDLRKKHKPSTQSIIKSSSPLKATIPMKKVAPLLKISSSFPETNTKSNLLQNMSAQIRSGLAKPPKTPLQRKGKSTLGAEVGYPSACSTPTVLITSPLKRTTGPLNKPRYSNLSATPTPKLSATNCSNSLSLKRRTITEFKAKSPLKPRVSSSTALAASLTSRASAVSSRLSTSAGGRISKTPFKTTPSTIKPTSRLSSRGSVDTPVASVKNKENKRP